jgi:hypothetical protein
MTVHKVNATMKFSVKVERKIIHFEVDFMSHKSRRHLLLTIHNETQSWDIAIEKRFGLTSTARKALNLACSFLFVSSSLFLVFLSCMKAIQRLKSLFVAPSQLQNAETKEKTFAFVSSFASFFSLAATKHKRLCLFNSFLILK